MILAGALDHLSDLRFFDDFHRRAPGHSRLVDGDGAGAEAFCEVVNSVHGISSEMNAVGGRTWTSAIDPMVQGFREVQSVDRPVSQFMQQDWHCPQPKSPANVDRS